MTPTTTSRVSRLLRLLPLALAAVLLAACSDDGSAEKDARPADAATDRGASDAPTPDAAASDALAPDTAAADSATPDAAADAGEADASASDAASDGATGCPYVGSWILNNIACGGNDLTALWTTTMGIASSLSIKQGPTGCLVSFYNTSSSCQEVEIKEWTSTATAGTWTSVSQGISFCQPASCTFGAADAPCAKDDRKGTTTTTTVTAFSAALLKFSEADSLVCPGQALTMSWKPQ